MKLSIVIPAYNEEKYLPETLGALRAALSTVQDAEVTVIDNESTDATREIAASFDVQIVTEHERNIGKVRNTGGFAASGDVIVPAAAEAATTTRLSTRGTSERLDTASLVS